MGIDRVKLRTPLNVRLSSFARASFGYGLVVKSEYNFVDRLLGFLVLGRPIFLILTPINAASAAVLALSGYPALSRCILGFCTVAFAAGAINAFNDYVDQDRDRHIWQGRPIPSGRIKPNEALCQISILFAASLAMSWFLFNPLTFLILLIAMCLGGLYSLFLRDRVGYLSLPPIVGMIYLGGWAAFSPETLLTGILPWYLYLMGLIWQTAHIMIYYPLHMAREGTARINTPPALFFRPSPKTAVGIGTGFICLTLLMSVLLPLLTPLRALYIVPVIAIGGYAINNSLRLMKDPLNREKGLRAFTAVSIFRLVISGAILLDILVLL